MIPIPEPKGTAVFYYSRLFFRNPYQALTELYQQFGPVFVFGVKPFRYIYLIGPEANHTLLAGVTENLRWREAFEVLTPIDGETALIVSDGADHKRRRRLVQPAFHKKRLDVYLDLMRLFASQTINQWQPGQTIDIYQALRATIRQVVIRTLFGEHLSKQSEYIGQQIQTILDFINLPIMLQVKWNIPGTPWHRAAKARQALDGLIYPEISRRRAAPDEADDVMALLLATQDETGDSLSDLEVRDQVASLIAAGYDTTSAAAGWAVYAMLQNTAVWQTAQAEVVKIVGNAPLMLEHLPQLTYLDWVVSETLRLYSPAVIGVRKVAIPFEYAGYTIPAGSQIIYSQYLTHRLPHLWPQPEQFRPERWNPAAADYRAPTPYEYIPFGGGARRCIGSAFAVMELKVILVELLQKTTLTLLPNPVTPTGLATMFPKEGVWVKVE